MSYILDALRRADAERERGAVPGLHAQPLALAPRAGAARRRPELWWVAAGALMLAAALAVVAWVLLRDGTVPVPAGEVPRPGTTSPLAAAPAEAAAPSHATASLPGAPQAIAGTAAPSPKQAVPAPQAPTTPARPAAALPSDEAGPPVARGAARKPAPAAAREPALASPAADEPRPRAASPAAAPAAPPSPPAERRILALDELPPEIRRSLPPLAVSGSIYSDDAASRFVMINGEAVHEGGRITPELTLEQIRLKSAVLRYKGYRYRIPL